MTNNEIKQELKNWPTIVAKYRTSNWKKAGVQMLNSFLPYFALWTLMVISLNWSYWITIGLAIINAFFLVRIFIIQHDCGHQSFLKSRSANRFLGYLSSFISTVPYDYWARIHNYHHAHNGQLETRGWGDIFFLTTEEYDQKSNFVKARYRVFRHPIVQFIVAPIIYFTLSLRFPMRHLNKWKHIRWSHLLNNLLILGIYIGLAFLIGIKTVLLVQIPIMLFFGIIAFWFFYIQHTHEENYNEWESEGEWDFLIASMKGSTYYKLPRLMRWLTGNIGLHHIHHLNSHIPNYNLQRCVEENPKFNEATNILSFRDSLKCIHHNLWDAKQGRMISFKENRRNY